ncbi:hypothetical protein ES703_91922 [subsurface metagenome]
MKIIVFSDLETIKTNFAGVKRSKNFTVEYHSCIELKKKLKSTDKNTFIYIDISRYDDQERNKLLKYLSGLESCRYGIVDPEGAVKDTALLFFGGASDYLGREVFKEGITAVRINKAAAFLAPGQPPGTEARWLPEIKNFIPSGPNWSGIKSGQEYTFCLMYVELNNHEALRKNLGEELITAVINSFRGYLQKSISPINGKVWMWDEFGGLILFPFDGEKCDAVLACFRLILNRKMICVENLTFNALFSYHIALHIGNTIYKSKGNTGTLVSDSINSIFHLGKKFTPPGNFYITKEVFMHSPEGLKKCFLPAGHFEGFEIMRMILPH